MYIYTHYVCVYICFHQLISTHLISQDMNPSHIGTPVDAPPPAFPAAVPKHLPVLHVARPTHFEVLPEIDLLWQTPRDGIGRLSKKIGYIPNEIAI